MALLFTSACILCLLSLPFSELIELDMSLYACSLAMELLSLLRLRWTEPELRRPYRVPLGRRRVTPRHTRTPEPASSVLPPSSRHRHRMLPSHRALCVMCTPPLLLCGLVISMSLRNPSMRHSWCAVLGIGVTLYNLGPHCFRQRERTS